MSGWIKLHRSITEHWLYKEKRVFSKFEAWNDILLTVNFSDVQTLIKGNIYYIKRGQSILSLESWGKRWNWDKHKVRRFFKLLEKDLMIELKSDTVTTQLTVCKYESYQDTCNTSATVTQRTRNTSATVTQLIEEEEERKEEKEEIYRAFKHLKLTLDEFNKLDEVYLKEDIDSVLDKIENYKLNNKYTSLYLTSLNWLKKEYKTKQEVIKNQYKISL